MRGSNMRVAANSELALTRLSARRNVEELRASSCERAEGIHGVVRGVVLRRIPRPAAGFAISVLVFLILLFGRLLAA